MITNDLNTIYELKKRFLLFIENSNKPLRHNNIIFTIKSVLQVFKKYNLLRKKLFFKKKHLNRFRKFIFLIPLYNYKNNLKKFIIKKKKRFNKGNLFFKKNLKVKFFKKFRKFLLKIKLIDLTYNILNNSKLNKSTDLVTKRLTTFKNLNLFYKAKLDMIPLKGIMSFNSIFFKKIVSIFLFLNYPILAKIFFFNLKSLV